MTVAQPASEPNRRLTATPWAIAVEVAHKRIQYGELVEELQDGYVLKLLKRAIFEAVRDAVAESSEPPLSMTGGHS